MDFGKDPKRRRVRSLDDGNLGNELLLQAVALCSKVPLFSSLEMSELPRLAAALSSQTYEDKQTMCRQGDTGDLFIVQSGKASVVDTRGGDEPEDQQELSHLGPGDCFGVQALLHGTGYIGTVIAQERMTVWVLGSEEFENLDLRHRLHYQKRQEVHEVALETDVAELWQSKNSEMSREVRELLREAMLANAQLGPHLQHLNEEELLLLVGSASKLPVVEAGKEVMRQGDAEGQLFYMVEDGLFDVARDGRHLRKLGPGTSFGEEAMLIFEKRRVTITADKDSTLWVLHRQQLRKVVEGRKKQEVEEHAALLRKAKDALPLPEKTESEQADILKLLAGLLIEKVFFQGEYIIHEGKIEEHPHFFILSSGDVVVEAAGREERVAQAIAGGEQIEFFGEEALRAEAPTTSVRVKSERVQVLALDRASFLQVVHPAKGSQQPGQADDKGAECERLSMDDFCEIGVLGWGAYAKVSLVRNNHSKKIYALKELGKGRVLQRKQVQQVRTERLVLKTTNSPFVLKMFGTFRTATHIKFLIEPCMGGDIYTICERHEIFHSDRHARYFSGCAVQGLAHLHERFIIYRDMKLENMLVDSGGCCKLADFGLAKFVVGHTFTLCGTPDYMAPEVITGVGHSCGCDWWSLGVIIFALMTGVLPFDAPRPQQTFLKIKRGIEPIMNITGFQGFWSDLVGALCKLAPSERLPVRRGGAAAVRHHKWYAKFNWQELDEGKMTPPYVPVVRNAEDLTNFDPNPEDAPPEVPYRDPGDDWDAEFAE